MGIYNDAHVHLRDFDQSHKETIEHALQVARAAGVAAVFDMPNTSPPIMDREAVERRLDLADQANNTQVFYGLYIGLTSGPEQIQDAVNTFQEFPQVVGMKLYAGHSVGKLGVTALEDQKTVYQLLTDAGYNGVLTVHCERDDLIFKDDRGKQLFDSNDPVSHSKARPEKAEEKSVEDQLQLLRDTNFSGKFNVTHVSTPGAVDLINAAKQDGLDVSSSVCPQHFMLDWKVYTGENGVLYKVNPPIRQAATREKMLQYLLEGKIDWIETDHAPHTLEEKTGGMLDADGDPVYMSGLPGLAAWPIFDLYLQDNGFSEEQIKKLTFSNVAERFGLNITYQKPIHLIDRTGDYAFNPYESIIEELGFDVYE